MRHTRFVLLALVLVACSSKSDRLAANSLPGAPLDWNAVDSATLKNFQALLRMDTRDPPGNEKPTAEYIVRVLKDAGIDAQVFALEPNRPNVVARIKGNGKKKPLLLMGHQDVVTVDTTKWRFPPFSATRDSGWVYARGALDDKTHLVADLMIMLLLKQQNVALDRDVIMLAEAGEEGTTRVGIQYMVDKHYPDIDAEYCLAEGGGVTRVGGQVRYSQVSTTEKIPRGIVLTAHGIAGHGSIPLLTNPIEHLSNAVAKFATWRAPVHLNKTTTEYFTRLAMISPPEKAVHYRDVISGDPKRVNDGDAWLLANEPIHSSMLRTSVAPTMITGGYRINVIPSEATATLDVRMIPGEDTVAFLETIKKLVDDPKIDVTWAKRDVRPDSPVADLNAEGFKTLEAELKRTYNAIVLPTMLTGATDMAYLRAKGMQCYGTGVAVDIEDGPKGYGPHGDQERVLENELYRFVHLEWDVVQALAKAK